MANGQARNRAVNSAGGFMRDFREFLMRGNVIDLAVAVVIGAAFSAIVNSFVADIITPLLLNPALKAAGVEDIANLSANGVKYGLFLSAVINFVVIGFVLFVLIRLFEKAKRKQDVEAAAEPSIEEKLNDTLTRLTAVVDRKL
ncbi:large conductance mechanosensitive channel protein MscL [Nodosilinea nodulosa]|uniref:large conductance mechanosensitive channel protein MscL n=1 Tax=Nodosilinea nodulosa TaxID=416001 RepID=UPI000686C69B|nr:large conductance mechanosensitive channel protein MscL [Nodosilinea nodulosa]